MLNYLIMLTTLEMSGPQVLMQSEVFLVALCSILRLSLNDSIS